MKKDVVAEATTSLATGWFGALFLFRPVLNRSVRCREARDGDAEGGAAHVIESHVVAELDGLGIAAVFAADAALEILARRASLLNGHPHQYSDAAGVEGLERVALEDFLL